MTTVTLQGYPVELHMMPLCLGDGSRPDCVATGDYFNDDGLTVKDDMNKTFTFNYNHNVSGIVGAAPDSMEINVLAAGNVDHINNNDELGGIQIYDYTNMNFTGAMYEVEATSIDKDGKTAKASIGEAVFRPKDDRLVWEPVTGATFVNLRNLKVITFTKKA